MAVMLPALARYKRRKQQGPSSNSASARRSRRAGSSGQPYQSHAATSSGGDRGGRGVTKGARSVPGPSVPKTLEELGLSKTQSSRWQQLAENPEAVERYQNTNAQPGGLPAL